MRIWKIRSLNHQLIIGTAMMVGFSLLLSISIVCSFFDAYQRADANLAALRVYRQVLVAANVLSAERGPMNAVLGADPGSDGPLRQRLADFRARSDAALAALMPADAEGAERVGRILSMDSVRRVRARLDAARAAVDDLSARPRAERSLEKIRTVIGDMFDVIDVLQPVITGAVERIIVRDDTLSGVVLMAQLFGDMREFAGRVGSYVMPAVVAHAPFDQPSIQQFREANGRLQEIWHLAKWRAGFYIDDPQLAVASQDISLRFFGFGLPMINDVVAQGRFTGNYGVTTAELTDRYVATLEPIERMRVAFLDLTIERPKAERAVALQWLVYVSVIAGLIVVANALIIFYARRFVFQPLMAAAGEIVALSEGREVVTETGIAHGREMRGLFEALCVLRLRLRERVQYTERLRVHAETDGLTGLANRRLLDRMGAGDETLADLPREIGLIMFDLDHFKQVNDRFGHAIGDEVLRRVAGILAAHAEAGDVAARYGGEEFVLCLAKGPGPHVAARAEAIRRAIEAMRLPIAEGSTLNVTASFGVASGARGLTSWPGILVAADRALYMAKSLGRNRVCESDAAGIVLPFALTG